MSHFPLETQNELSLAQVTPEHLLDLRTGLNSWAFCQTLVTCTPPPNLRQKRSCLPGFSSLPRHPAHSASKAHQCLVTGHQLPWPAVPATWRWAISASRG